MSDRDVGIQSTVERELVAQVRRLDETLRTVLSGRAFTPRIHLLGDVGGPAFENGWANVGGADLAAGFWRDPFGAISFEGAVSGGTIGLAICTLPVGFRPTATVAFAVTSNGAFGRVAVTAAGVVTPTVGSAVGVRLDGIRFRAV